MTRTWLLFVLLGACAHRAPAVEIANQSRGARAGELVLAGGDSVPIDQVLIWTMWDGDEHVTWMHTVLLGGGVEATCAEVAADAPLRAPIALIVHESAFEASDDEDDEDPLTTDGWVADVDTTGVPALVSTEEISYQVTVDVERRDGEHWVVRVSVADGSMGEHPPVATGHFDARWCGDMGSTPLDPEGD